MSSVMRDMQAASTIRPGLVWLVHKLWAMALLVFGQRTRAQAVFDTMLRRWPGDAYALASRAHLHAQAGRPDDAIRDAQTVVDLHPAGDASHWFNLAFLLEASDRLPEAENAFRKALALDDKLDRAWYGLGLALIRMERLDDALTAFRRNTELQPMSPYGWYQLARVHMQRHEPGETQRIIRHLKGFEPKVAAQLERETGLTTRGDAPG